MGQTTTGISAIKANAIQIIHWKELSIGQDTERLSGVTCW